MWNLDDPTLYFKFLSVSVDFSYTWGDSDRKKREDIRRAVALHWPSVASPAAWWAFRIYTHKKGDNWDVENVPKLIVDAFSREQISKDNSSYSRIGLYPDDTVKFVRMVQVMADMARFREFTVIEIFGAHWPKAEIPINK